MEDFIVFDNVYGKKNDEYDEEAYNCCNTLEEVLAKLEE